MKAGWRYSQVASTFWADRKIRTLSEDARTLAAYLLTCPDRTAEGFYGLPRVLVLDHLGWHPERFEAARTELAEADFAEYDDDAEAVLIVKALKYNAPSGMKQVKGALATLEAVHDAPALFWRFLAAADRYAPALAGAVRERYEIAADGAAEPRRRLSERAQMVIEAVRAVGRATTAEVAAELGFDAASGTFKRALVEAVDSGEIRQPARGIYEPS